MHQTHTDDATAAAGQEVPSKTGRLVSIDVLRGAVLAVMILTPVTASGGSYPYLAHAEWNGFTVSDAVFPAFLVTSGVSLAFLLRPPLAAGVTLRLTRRLIALVVIGIGYNALGQPLDMTALRLTGVLQMIGVSGAIAAAVVLASRRLTESLVPVALVTAVLPLVYGVSLAMPAADCTRTDAGCSPWFALDVDLIGLAHTYREGAVGVDPEGVAVMVVASSFVLLGFLAGEWVRRHVTITEDDGGMLVVRDVLPIVLSGVVLVALGLWVGGIQPVNKRLHTPAFSALAGGTALLALGVTLAVVDLRTRLSGRPAALVSAARRTLSHPLATLGRNALVVYLTEHVLLTGLTMTTVGSGTAARALLDAIPVDGDRVHLVYTAVLLAAVLLVTYSMRLLRWRIVL